MFSLKAMPIYTPTFKLQDGLPQSHPFHIQSAYYSRMQTKTLKSLAYKSQREATVSPATGSREARKKGGGSEHLVELKRGASILYL